MDIEGDIYREGMIALVAAALPERVPLVKEHLNSTCEWDDGPTGDAVRCVTHMVTLMPSFDEATPDETARMNSRMGLILATQLDTAAKILLAHRNPN